MRNAELLGSPGPSPMAPETSSAPTPAPAPRSVGRDANHGECGGTTCDGHFSYRGRKRNESAADTRLWVGPGHSQNHNKGTCTSAFLDISMLTLVQTPCYSFGIMPARTPLGARPVSLSVCFVLGCRRLSQRARGHHGHVIRPCMAFWPARPSSPSPHESSPPLRSRQIPSNSVNNQPGGQAAGETCGRWNGRIL